MSKLGFKIPAGWRRLKSTDIIRVGDREWTKYTSIAFTPDDGNNLVSEDSFLVGKTLNDYCGEWGNEYPNNIFRKIKPKCPFF